MRSRHVTRKTYRRSVGQRGNCMRISTPLPVQIISQRGRVCLNSQAGIPDDDGFSKGATEKGEGGPKWQKAMLLVSLLVPFAKTNRRPKIRRPFRLVISTEFHRDIRPKNRSPAGPKLLLNNWPRTFRQESSLPEEPTVPDLARSMEKTTQQ
ncbi:hypothetical protein M431DRAFT_338986 [Trichoderma harzianum CBS 226.95]|uniref:Uncharacterized protein n=1 Tax=Trichoderma harzianum CBS 226.95 TaxID=983964 RepID=A0A2T4AJX3_TRIHA|nr:hypothetical protein M431DRAFT_338986 [Trichoderma harzianum CBS 226.95]PTB57359.1 hypothetical protein M431DRAFT_338986 [Trichoderma harzianum CBS 226.95]